MLLIRFETAVICLGVVLAMIGPRMTQESFSLFKLWQLIDCMCAMAGLRTVLGAGMGDWFA